MNTNCVQGRCTLESKSGKECEGCGFDRSVYERRLWLLRHKGLTKRKNGLRCLVLEKERGEAGK